jgi:RHS repeat-associated protein
MYVPSSQGTGWSPGSFTPTSPSWFNAKNQLVNPQLGIAYDVGGNLTAIGGFTFKYDAENRLVSSTLNSVTTNYVYDGEGRRVKKGSVVMVYDAFGRLAAEYGGTADPVGTEYLTADHLGSTRLVTSSTGAERRCLDYLPFGEQMTQGMGTRGTCYASATEPRVKFTGKERDQETGLDYFGARYFSGAQGRFTSPDAPFADQHPENPQSWNLYQYGYNSPLANIDIDGRSVWSKAVKVVVKVAKTGNAAAGFADNIQDAATLLNPAASPLQRIGAGLSLASELLPVSVGDVKDAGRLLGFIDDAVDAGKQVVRRADDVADTGKKIEGVYEFSEKGKTYVGQSGDVAGRLNQHLESGKLVPGTTVTVTPVSGGKTAREVAEQKRINQLGGTANKPGSQTTNQRNPIGPKRQKRIEDEYGPLNQE